MGVVAWNGTRIDAADSASTTANIGGGAGAGAEPDIVYQGTGATPEEVSRKQGTGSGGFAILPTQSDISTGGGTYQTLVLKYAAANSAALELLSVPGLQSRVGSGQNDYAQYDFAGADAYPEKGGFVFLCVDPNITGYRTATQGSPSFTAADYFGIVSDFTATSKSENLIHSAIDVGDGYTVTGTVAAYSDISAFNSILANRHGYFFALEGEEGAYGQYGTVRWGTSGTSVDYQSDENVTVFLLDGFYEAGWSRTIDDCQNASTNISPTGSISLVSRGSAAGATDTRAVYEYIDGPGTHNRPNLTLGNHADVILGAGGTWADFDFETANLQHNGGTLSTGIIRCTSLSGVAVTSDFTPADASNVTWIQAGSGHAIEITSPGVYAFSSLFFQGFGADGTNDAAVYNNSGGAVTINVSGGGDSPTVRDGAGATTTVNNAISLTISGLIDGGILSIFDNEDSDPQFLGTNLETQNPVVGTSFVYSHSTPGNAVIVQFLATGFEEVNEPLTLAATDQTITLRPELEANIEWLHRKQLHSRTSTPCLCSQRRAGLERPTAISFSIRRMIELRSSRWKSWRRLILAAALRLIH